MILKNHCMFRFSWLAGHWGSLAVFGFLESIPIITNFAADCQDELAPGSSSPKIRIKTDEQAIATEPDSGLRVSACELAETYHS